MEDVLQTAIRQYEAGQFEEAAQRLQVLLKRQPYNSDAVYYFGLAARAKGQLIDAINLLRTATVISPTEPKFHNSLGDSLYDFGQTGKAVDAWNKALELAPNDPQANRRMAGYYRDFGDVPRAVVCLRRSLESNPDQPRVHSELLHLLQHDPSSDEFTLYGEHIEYFRRHAVPLAAAIEPLNLDFLLERPIRVGYICPDFRAPGIACFMTPILKSHRTAGISVALYSDAPINAQSQPNTSPHLSRSITALDNRQVADQIRRDQVDILVDLAVHSPGNRMLVFARKPAPIQVTYLPYPGSTGLSTVMYRMTDVWLDPHGSHHDFRIENLVRLPTGYVCYQPPADIRDMVVPAAPIRFACSCQLMQLNDGVLRAWAQDSRRVPDARLAIEAPKVSDALIAQRFMERCDAAGIPRDRVDLQPYLDAATSMQWLARSHIALDPFPFNTMTTACDAAWLGMPLVTLAGAMPPGRFGYSLLNQIHAPETIAADQDAYIRIAVDLAQDILKLNPTSPYRTELRQNAAASKLADADRFIRNLEAAYREMWKRRCGAGK